MCAQDNSEPSELQLILYCVSDSVCVYIWRNCSYDFASRMWPCQIFGITFIIISISFWQTDLDHYTAILNLLHTYVYVCVCVCTYTIFSHMHHIRSFLKQLSQPGFTLIAHLRIGLLSLLLLTGNTFLSSKVGASQDTVLSFPFWFLHCCCASFVHFLGSSKEQSMCWLLCKFCPVPWVGQPLSPLPISKLISLWIPINRHTCTGPVYSFLLTRMWFLLSHCLNSGSPGSTWPKILNI